MLPKDVAIHKTGFALGGVPTEVFTLKNENGMKKAAILYLHGGAFCLTNGGGHRGFLSHLCKECKLYIYAIDYRRPPEYPYPCALIDAIKAYQYLLEDLKIRPENIIIMGDSAGGNLALSLAIAIRDGAVGHTSLASPSTSECVPFIERKDSEKWISNETDEQDDCDHSKSEGDLLSEDVGTFGKTSLISIEDAGDLESVIRVSLEHHGIGTEKSVLNFKAIRERTLKCFKTKFVHIYCWAPKILLDRLHSNLATVNDTEKDTTESKYVPALLVVNKNPTNYGIHLVVPSNPVMWRQHIENQSEVSNGSTNIITLLYCRRSSKSKAYAHVLTLFDHGTRVLYTDRIPKHWNLGTKEKLPESEVAKYASNLPSPAGVCLLSPWVDIGGIWRKSWKENLLYDFLPKDIAHMCACEYAGHLRYNLNDPKLSPVYNDLHNLPSIHVELGDLEVLKSQIMHFVKKAASSGVDISYNVAAAMVHVYPVFVMLKLKTKEPQICVERIAEFVLNKIK